VDVDAMGIDLLSISAHKLYGPKGCGALYVRSTGPRVRLAPMMHGGGHERGMRSGTLNVPGVVGFGMACEVAIAEFEAEQGRILSLRERLRRGIFDRLDDVYLNGHPSCRLAGNLNVSFAHVDGESLLLALEGVAVSSGSACTSATLEPSYVLRAMGVSDEMAHSSIRFGIGRFNGEEEVDYVASRVVEEVGRLREMSPSYAISKRKRGHASV
jgi:cysteine desulfurase